MAIPVTHRETGGMFKPPKFVFEHIVANTLSSEKGLCSERRAFQCAGTSLEWTF